MKKHQKATRNQDGLLKPPPVVLCPHLVVFDRDMPHARTAERSLTLPATITMLAVITRVRLSSQHKLSCSIRRYSTLADPTCGEPGI